MFYLDIYREISKFLNVKDCLHLEVAIQEKMYKIQDYKMRLKYEAYELIDKFTYKAYYAEKFKCIVSSKQSNIFVISLCNVNSTKEACMKAKELISINLLVIE